MRKCDMYKNMNRNSTIVNQFHRNNEERNDVSTPSVVMGQVWVQEAARPMEIIELDSDDSEQQMSEADNFNFDNVWNYLNHDHFSAPHSEFYKANKKAREKRRMRNTYDYEEELRESIENINTRTQTNQVFASFYDFTNDLTVRNTKEHQSNCFTIYNKPFVTPESSSDEIEYKDRLNSLDDFNNNDSPYSDEIVNFDENIDSSKRTVWIYSFRNKRVLSENDFELINIPSQDSTSSTTCSLENFCEERTETKKVCRVSSPIPATYVPRLNLSMTPTLPTVAEITEPSKNSMRDTPKSDENPSTRQRCVNNWLANNDVTARNPKMEEDKQDKSSITNSIDWMCLSPRERRRRFRHTSTGSTYQPTLPVLSEVPSSEPVVNSSRSQENGLNKIETKVEINVVKSEEAETQTPKKSLLTCKTINNEQPTGKTDEFHSITDNETDLNLLSKPKIILNVTRTTSKITDPIEKLNSNKWIREEGKSEVTLKELDASEFNIIELKTDSTRESSKEENVSSKKLWMRNMSLLKPVEWSEYMPITGSIPSLHLSLASDSVKQTWFSRLAKCFRCFK